MSSSIDTLQREVNDFTLKVEELTEESKYDEAAQYHKRLEIAKRKLTDAKKQELIKDHEDKQAQLREAFHQMEKKFSHEWDDEMKKFEVEAHQLVDDTKKNQESELQTLEDSLAREPEEPFRPSTELANLRATEKQLAKLKKFQEAQRAKLAADQLEQTERARFAKDEQQRRESLKNEMKTQHQKDLAVLEKKIERERKEKNLQRENDTARLEQRYRNLMRDQRNEQRQQTNSFEKELNAIKGKEAGIAISSPGKSINSKSPSSFHVLTVNTLNAKRVQQSNSQGSLSGTRTKDKL